MVAVVGRAEAVPDLHQSTRWVEVSEQVVCFFDNRTVFVAQAKINRQVFRGAPIVLREQAVSPIVNLAGRVANLYRSLEWVAGKEVFQRRGAGERVVAPELNATPRVVIVEKVRDGCELEAELQSVLTRALGTEESVEVDADEIELFPRDSLLLCSDGLTRMVPEPEIASILLGAPDVASAAESLVNRANEYGGLDNVTVVVIRVNKSRNWFAKFVPWFSANLT